MLLVLWLTYDLSTWRVDWLGTKKNLETLDDDLKIMQDVIFRN